MSVKFYETGNRTIHFIRSNHSYTKYDPSLLSEKKNDKIWPKVRIGHTNVTHIYEKRATAQVWILQRLTDIYRTPYIRMLTFYAKKTNNSTSYKPWRYSKCKNKTLLICFLKSTNLYILIWLYWMYLINILVHCIIYT